MRLIKKIQEKRKKLNNYDLDDDDAEMLKISQELDELILKYTQKKAK